MRRVPAFDPDAAKSAVRVAVVAPALLAIGEAAIGNLDIALFAFFGSFALLVFAQFAGPRRSSVRAYLGLAVVGFPLVALGTICSHDAWVAAAMMAIVGFAILFAGVINGYVAAAATAAILLFVLPVMVPAANSQIPDRLAGWALACAVAIPAVLALWPARPQRVIRRRIADACGAIAACLEPRAERDRDGAAARADRAVAAVREARRRFAATPYRPTGATGATAAVAHLVSDVAWITPAAAMECRRDDPRRFRAEGAEVKDVCRDVLQSSASLLEGQPARPDLKRLERARSAIGAAFSQRLEAAGVADDDLAPAFDEAFRLRFLSFAVWQIGARAMVAAGEERPRLGGIDADPATASDSRLDALRRLAGGYANPRAVWFRNSLRGAVALSVAVLIGQLTDVQHAFWVVLGTLGVLRSNALGTGSSVVRALAGTVVGIAVGGAILVAVGTNVAVLWAIVPITVFVAAYAPRAMSFLAGQAAFTIAVLTVFNIIEPAGWEVGLVRVEDVAIGCAIASGVGILLWPRGAAGVVRDCIASAYRRASDYLAQTVRAMTDGASDELPRAESAADESLLRLDDAFRQYLAERSSAARDLDGLAGLVAGATRVVRVARAERSGHALFRLEPHAAEPVEVAGARRTLEDEVAELRGWYEALGEAVAAGASPPPPLATGARTEEPVLEWVPAEAARGERRQLRRGLAIAWADKLLDTLRAIQPSLADAAAGLGRGPACAPDRNASGE